MSTREEDRHINFALMRDRLLARQSGKEYWRSLEELADTDEFEEFMNREFPQHAEEWNDPVGRRTFLKLMGASLALAGLSACAYQPPEKIVPYVTQPGDMIPGKPLYYATAMELSGVGLPLLARSNEGRPTKLEGNNLHRASDGATDIFSQASLLSLYDPDRSQTISYREEQRTWGDFIGAVRAKLDELRPNGGAGLRFLTETVTSPTLAFQLAELKKEYPQARWHQYEPAGRHGATLGAMRAFGRAVNTNYDFSKADRILSLDSDFLACGPGSIRFARDFAARRRLEKGQTDINRLYVVESTPTNTGAKADHRLSLRPSEMEAFARTVAAKLGANIGALAGAPAYSANASWIDALVEDLNAHRGRSIVTAGDEQSEIVHALAHAMNEKLGNVNQTVSYTAPIEANPVNQWDDLRQLVADIDAGQVDTIVFVGGNPVYNAPADLALTRERLDKIKLRIHLSLYKDETSELCHWHIPAAHYLESWSDTRAYDGTVLLIQPLIQPLYEGKTAHELLAVFSTASDRTSYDIVRDYWMRAGFGATARPAAAPSPTPAAQPTPGSARPTPTPASRPSPTPAATPGQTPQPAPQQQPATATTQPTPTPEFEERWRKALHDGFIENSAPASVQAALAPNWTAQPAPEQGSFEIVFRTDPTVYDGRFANNGWLQELPKPLTKITWDNAALISPRTAQSLGINNDIGVKGGDINLDQVTINYRGRTLTLPVWVMPGQPDNVITVHLGYGRTRAGRVGNERGFNAYTIRTSDAPWFGTGAQVSKAATRFPVAVTQLHFNMENRDIVRAQTLAEYLHNPESAKERTEGFKNEEAAEEISMYGPGYDYSAGNGGFGYAWGMAIDVSSCVGCNACVVACQAENNIPVVGKEQVMRSREMHWLRVDAYFKGDGNNPEGVYFMPVPCMHCENAPCEPVCPVHATVHSAEGLNDMVYNRCVGTRYCSNNCPYKVRRFNFLLYQDFNTPTYQLMRNPDVTVRSRGVMEKCTYCVQRIQYAKIESEKEGNRRIAEGEIVTACQGVCPTEAIVFGDINDPKSRVAQLKREQRNYSLLADLNTKPRTTYLAAIRNPNEKIEKA